MTFSSSSILPACAATLAILGGLDAPLRGKAGYIPAWKCATIIGDSTLYESGGKSGDRNADAVVAAGSKRNAKVDGSLTLGVTFTGSLFGPDGATVMHFDDQNFNWGGGYGALANITSGLENTALGAFSLAANSGQSNTSVGSNSMQTNSSGGQNTAFGGQRPVREHHGIQ